MTPYPVIRDVCCLAVKDESVLHSTSLLQGKCGSLICLIPWVSLVTPQPVIRDVCCLAVNLESFLHPTSLLQGKCGALNMLDHVGQPCDSIPCVSACVLLGSEP